MNILLKITEIVILARLRPYILPSWVDFLALKTRNLGNGLSKSPQIAYKS